MVLFKKNIREKPIAIGFDPVESNQHLNEMRLKKGLLEKESANYSYLRNAGEVQNTISPVKPRVLLNTILSFVITIIICVFFVFIIEYTKNEKNQNKEVHKCNAL
jgi:capsular polysaccharide biosynthesis protein